MDMPNTDHTQLLDRLSEIKENSLRQFGELTAKIDVNTVKTTAIESAVSEVRSELKDIRLSFVTHSEAEARFKTMKEDMTGVDNKLTNKTNDHETRIRRLEYWGFIAIGLLFALQFYFNYLRG